MRLIYSTLFRLLLPVIALRLLWRSRRAPAYRRRMGERLGYFSPPNADKPLLWLHAVSLGETLAARPLLERLLAELPDYRIAVTTTTPTGSSQLRELFGDRVFHVYAPWDTPGAVRRCMDRLKPRLLIIMETELWPNLLHRCKREGCRVLLANARLSQRSADGYARFGSLTRTMLGHLDGIAAQNEDAARRFRALGAPSERVFVAGSIKFDLTIDDHTRASAAALREQWNPEARSVLIAASTHDGEETLLLEAFRTLRERDPAVLLILVPRHPERFDAVYSLCRGDGWQVLRRSAEGALDESAAANTDILLLDTIGELLQSYGLADVAVIGGSFACGDRPRGGHNPLEPAAWGVPVLTGPSMFNFEQIAAQLAAVEALEQVADADALGSSLRVLMEDDALRQRRGAAGRAVVEANRGALETLFSAITAQLT